MVNRDWDAEKVLIAMLKLMSIEQPSLGMVDLPSRENQGTVYPPAWIDFGRHQNSIKLNAADYAHDARS